MIARITISLVLVGVAAGYAQPVITREPADQSVSLFADAIFRVTVSGDAPLNYEWQFNDQPVRGMTNSLLTITNVQLANAGSYKVVVTNSSGSTVSAVAALRIVPFNAFYFFGDSLTDTHNCGASSWP